MAQQEHASKIDGLSLTQAFAIHPEILYLLNTYVVHISRKLLSILITIEFNELGTYDSCITI